MRQGRDGRGPGGVAQPVCRARRRQVKNAPALTVPHAHPYTFPRLATGTPPPAGAGRYFFGARMHLLGRLILLVLLVAPAAPARALDLPVRDPDRDVIDGPSYRSDALELRLAPAASRQAAIGVASARLATTPAGPSARVRLPELGVARVDGVARALGGATFEPEFRGETPPGVDSGAPDLAAFFIVHLPRGARLEEALLRFAALPEVAVADPIAVLPVSAVPDDSLWTRAWWLYDPPTRADIHAPEAWDVSMGDSGVVVAVLDTGILPWHPDLGGTLAGGAGHLWVNAAERDGVAGVDDDGNGWVDDVAGWDFVDLLTGYGVPAGEDWQGQDPDPSDYAGHGSFVAGLIGALPDNGIGLPGAAWNVRLMPVRMAWATTSNPLGLVDMSFAAQAIHYAWKNGASVINASWASLLQNGLDAAAHAAMQNGVTLVCAAGNNGQPHELAGFEDAIEVAATDATDVLAPFSNRGARVDLSAPGVNMASTFVTHAGTDSIGARTPSYMAGLDGTSFAAPLVAGAAALVHAYRRARGMKPLTAPGMRLRLRDTADDIAGLNPGGGFGAGRLRLDRALTDGPRSQALRMGHVMIGAPVVLATSQGGTRIVSAHFDQTMVMLDGQDGDTTWVAPTPGVPLGQVAAADLGGGIGVALFVGTGPGRIAGFDAHGRPLAGWPVTVPGFLPQPLPALGDIDGDGRPDVVASTGDRVVAYHADATPVTGFPVMLPATTTEVALADLDGQPGMEIVVGAAGSLYVLDGQGQVVTGWPVSAGLTRPPVVGLLAPFATPSIVAIAGAQMSAYAPDGAPRWGPRDLGGAALGAPALGDLDGDGALDIVVPTSAPNLAAFDSLGMPLAGWPAALASPPSGHPVIGPLDASGRAAALVYRSGGLVAFDDSARAISGYPRPGGVGPAPTLAEIDADGRTEILAGTDSRWFFYIYDAGPDTWTGPAAWPTARGNFARTGAAGVQAPVIEDLRPASVSDLSVLASTDTGATLGWTAVGEDGVDGRPASYEVRAATRPIDAATFDAAPIRFSQAAAVDAGGQESSQVSGLGAPATWWFAVRAVDAAGQAGGISNNASITLTGGGPLAGRPGPAIVARALPSRLPVELYWKAAAVPAPGPQKIELFDISGRLVRTLPLDAAPQGIATWDGRTNQGDRLRAGMYFARLMSGSFHAQARVVLLP